MIWIIGLINLGWWSWIIGGSSAKNNRWKIWIFGTGLVNAPTIAIHNCYCWVRLFCPCTMLCTIILMCSKLSKSPPPLVPTPGAVQLPLSTFTNYPPPPLFSFSSWICLQFISTHWPYECTSLMVLVHQYRLYIGLTVQLCVFSIIAHILTCV